MQILCKWAKFRKIKITHSRINQFSMFLCFRSLLWYQIKIKTGTFLKPHPTPNYRGWYVGILPIHWFWSEFTDIFETELVGVSVKKKVPANFHFLWSIRIRFLRKTSRRDLEGWVQMKFRRKIDVQILAPLPSPARLEISASGHLTSQVGIRNSLNYQNEPICNEKPSKKHQINAILNYFQAHFAQEEDLIQSRSDRKSQLYPDASEPVLGYQMHQIRSIRSY